MIISVCNMLIWSVSSPCAVLITCPFQILPWGSSYIGCKLCLISVQTRVKVENHTPGVLSVLEFLCAFWEKPVRLSSGFSSFRLCCLVTGSQTVTLFLCQKSFFVSVNWVAFVFLTFVNKKKSVKAPTYARVFLDRCQLLGWFSASFNIKLLRCKYCPDKSSWRSFELMRTCLIWCFGLALRFNTRRIKNPSMLWLYSCSLENQSSHEGEIEIVQWLTRCQPSAELLYTRLELFMWC